MIQSILQIGTPILQADICVVGSGAAGISFALQFIDAGMDVILLEAGDMKPDQQTQSLYSGEVTDEALHSPPDKYRQRRFGGSTTIWGGRCVPFDPIDFEPRPYIANSGWPISYQEVAQYYPRASTLCEAGEGDYSGEALFGKDVDELLTGFCSDRVSTDSLERFSRPTDFGRRYCSQLARAKNIRVLTKANCTLIALAQDGNSVKGVDVSTLEGRKFRVEARQVVIATGGLEVPRLLLASRDIHRNGIGNHNDVVGRYYMCHIAGNIGRVTLRGSPSLVRHGYLRSSAGVYCRRRLSLSPQEQKRQEVGNLIARLHFPDIVDPSHKSGVLSGLFLAKFVLSYEYAKRLQSPTQQPRSDYLRHVANVLADPLDTARFLSHWVGRHVLADRKFPSVILRNRVNRFSLDVHGEQEPRKISRVTLGDTVDHLGMRRLCIDWGYSRQDMETVKRSLKVISEELLRTEKGSLFFDPEHVEEQVMRYGAYGGHHIGTARMGNNPYTSVVDSNCRVHGVNNLYIAGAAVFPTSSQANPTLTVVALSLRLAKHLKEQTPYPQRAGQ